MRAYSGRNRPLRGEHDYRGQNRGGVNKLRRAAAKRAYKKAARQEALMLIKSLVDGL